MRYRRTASTPALMFAAAALFACGNETDTGNMPEPGDESGPSSASSLHVCLPAADISNALGLEVLVLDAGTRVYGSDEVCAYQGTDDELSASVTTIVGPAEQAEEVFGEMRESVALFLGSGAQPDAIDVGEGGYAYGGGSKSEAAAVSGGRLYRAEVVSSTSADIGDKRAALIDIVGKMMAAQ